jgi:acetyl-CoA carboxylase biotin carboxylase subunit
MFRKILVANRGEIALRVIAACRELGIKTVAVFSEPERDYLHAKLADEAFCIGPADVRLSYLNIPAIMSAVELTGAEAIHPGYGFLSENPHFAEVCEESEVVFIGPSYETMQKVGDKLSAKEVAKKAGVPVVPGSSVLKGEDDLKEAASRIGYPLIIKAAAGGGGRGMRVVRGDFELLENFHAARTEAEASFGIGDVYVEKRLEGARHIEVQILGDKWGNVIHCGERECSIQRRYQKVIEESPAPGLDPKIREEIWEAAVRVAKALRYRNAGTIEFLVTEEGFYFIETNARIQVEHPISEERARLNLIKEQIRIAAGEKLSYNPRLKGHAIECRINAEDPKSLIPSSGVLRIKHLPSGYGVRLDTHIYDGMEVTPYYDSLLAKLITYGQDRQEALARMSEALKRFKVEGVKTSRDLCQKIIENADFQQGRISTTFLESFL